MPPDPLAWLSFGQLEGPHHLCNHARLRTPLEKSGYGPDYITIKQVDSSESSEESNEISKDNNDNWHAIRLFSINLLIIWNFNSS